MERFDFLVLGGAGTHYIMKVDKIPDNDVSVYVQNQDFDELFCGGTGLNIIYSLIKISGRKAVLLTSTNECYGCPALKKLKEFHIDTGYVEVVKGKSACYIIEDEAGRRLTILGGKCEKISGCEMPDELFEKADLAIFSMDSKPNVERFLQKLEKHKTPFAFCMRSDRTIFTDDLLRKAVPKAKLLFCNEFEQGLIEEVLEIESIADLLEGESTELIVVTCGKKGANLYERGGRMTRVPTTQAEKIVDRTGAGDAFAAGFLFGYTERMPPVECVKLGATLSSFVIEKVGCITGSPTRGELLDRYYNRPDVAKERKL